MALPTIRFLNEYEGTDKTASDTHASGAGPEVSISAEDTARNVKYGGSKIGLEEEVDLSQVAVDGSHVWFYPYGSARRFYPITGKKEGRLATTGDTHTNQTLDNVPDVTGVETNDIVIVKGADSGGTDLVTSVDSITGTGPYTVTLHVATSANLTGAVVIFPQSVTLGIAPPATPSLLTDRWAIGGYRLHLTTTSNLQLFGSDLQPGWSVEVYNSGQDYTIASAITVSISGDTTSGRITIKGIGRPVLNGPGGGSPAFTLNANYYTIEGFEVEDGHLVKLNSSTVKNTRIRDCKFTENTSMSGVEVGSAVTEGKLVIEGCECTGREIVTVNGVLTRLCLRNCYSHDSNGNSKLAVVNTATPVDARRCVVDGGYCGVEIGSTSGTRGPSIFENCVFAYLVHYGIGVGHLDGAQGIVITNCVFDHIMTAAVYLPTGSDYVTGLVDYNAFQECMVNYSGVTAGVHDYLGTITWRDRTTGDFRAIELEDSGYPESLPGGAGNALPAVGYCEMSGALGGNIALRVLGVVETATSYIVSYQAQSGTESVWKRSVVVLKSLVPRAGIGRSEAVKEAALAWLRDNSAADMAGKDVKG